MIKIDSVNGTEALRMLRFGIVGVTSTLIYGAVFMLSVEWLGVSALLATTFGYLVTVAISYFGHQGFSFAVAPDHAEYFPRFAALSVTSYLINLGIVALTVDVLGFSYKTAVVLVMLLIPVINYLLSRYWVFYAGILRLERER